MAILRGAFGEETFCTFAPKSSLVESQPAMQEGGVLHPLLLVLALLAPLVGNVQPPNFPQSSGGTPSNFGSSRGSDDSFAGNRVNLGDGEHGLCTSKTRVAFLWFGQQ
mmetsp:Transcript_17945/g.48755  ORF Transcript_17945/g.48755 Transcript_17945/m.48755 type:complete len:108 (+) Transcript_17945:2630-2953(+)